MLVSTFYAYQFFLCLSATEMLRLMLLSECAENLKSSLLETPPFSETVCPVGVFFSAKSLMSPFRLISLMCSPLILA